MFFLTVKYASNFESFSFQNVLIADFRKVAFLHSEFIGVPILLVGKGWVYLHLNINWKILRSKLLSQLIMPPNSTLNFSIFSILNQQYL